MTVFGVSLLDLALLTFCFTVPFAVLALVVTVLYRRDRRRTPPEAANIAGDIHPRYPPRRLKPTGGIRRVPPSPSAAVRPGDDVDAETR